MRFYLITTAIAASLFACRRDRTPDGLSKSGDSTFAPTTATSMAATVDSAGQPLMFAANEDTSGTRLCFEASDLTLTPGTRVTVVYAALPQYAAVGKLESRSKRPCFPAPPGSADSMEYVVTASADTTGRRGAPIIVIGKIPPVQMVGDTVTLSIEPGKTPWRFRECASMEGIHITAWSGIPLKAPRRWHAYYYVGYDLEPNCQAADYEPDSSATKS